MKTEVDIKIRGYHIDQFLVVNNARYLEFLEEGRWDYLETCNLIPVLHANNISHSVAGIQINYRKPLSAGQVIRIETSLLNRSRHSITMLQSLFLQNTENLIAEAQVTSVFTDTVTGKVLPVNKNIFRLWPELLSIPERKSTLN